MAIEPRNACERSVHMLRIDRRVRSAVRVKAVVARHAGARDALLAEVVRDARVTAAAESRVFHDLVDARIGVGLEQCLLLEVDRCAGQPADAAVGLDDVGATEQVEGRPCVVHGDAAALPVIDRVAPFAQQLAVHRAHHVAFGIRLLDEELLQLAVRRAVQQDAFGRLAIASRAPGLLVILLEAAGKVVVDHPADIGEVHAHAER